MKKQDLADGIYEKIISKSFDRELQAAIQDEKVWAHIEEMDSQEAVPYLAHYIQKLVQCCLKEIADHDEDDALNGEMQLTNELIDLLSKRHTELGTDHIVTRRKFLLTQLLNRQNQLCDHTIEHPMTSLSRSFLFTNSHKDISLVTELRREIISSDRIDFLVSFIRFSGLTLILPQLRKFTARGGRLRIITTTYMGATDPKAIQRLAELPNTHIRISYNVKETRLHAKSYIFHRESGYSTAYVGSSNLSHAAIADGLEWNMKITQQDLPGILEKMTATFETYWHADDFEHYTGSTDEFQQLRQAIDHAKKRDTTAQQDQLYHFTLRPYPYQQTILDALQVERQQRHHWRNLIVAATGTGKTAIAAFDYQRFAQSRQDRPRLLFVAHREEILRQSRSCFQQVLHDPAFGELAVGSSHAENLAYLFISIQTFNSCCLWDKLSPSYYDMIIVDEFHHAAAASYQRLLNYFTPKILLGLTATPERMDGKDILAYFDHRIAAEIRLPDAIERRLLCPFHYFGVEDPIDLSTVNWIHGQYDTNALNNLYVIESLPAQKRAKAILQSVDQYTADIRDVKGLGFCVSKKHAHFMADYFNAHKIQARSLDSETPNAERLRACQDLENGRLTFLFVVDLFNEGVDIPAINTVLFLRPTNSITVFLQQLGRGLRLAPGKDCLTVLDFVAQSNRNYDFASRLQAMLGHGQPVKIRQEVQTGFPHVPKGCSIQLEEIAQKYILDNIHKRLSKNNYYRELIRELYTINHHIVPGLSDFLHAAQLSPQVFYNGNRSYARLCAEAGIIEDFPGSEEETLMKRAFPRILGIDAPHWLQFLQAALKDAIPNDSVLAAQYLRMWQFTIWGKEYREAGMRASQDAITQLTQIPPLKKELLELLDYQYQHIGTITKRAEVPYLCPLEVHCHYSRDQIFAGLGLEKPSSVREGVKYLHAKNSNIVTQATDIFLVTLNKSSNEFSDTTRYEDYSIDSHLFHWQSQSTTSAQSPTGQRYIQQNKNGNIVLLFVRENKKNAFGHTENYAFLGTAHIVSHHGSQPITIIYRLDEAIPAKYLAMTDSSGVL